MAIIVYKRQLECYNVSDLFLCANYEKLVNASLG